MDTKRNLRSGNIVMKILLPVIFIVGSVSFALILYFLKGDPDKKEVVKVVPRVEVAEVTVESLTLTVESQGTVQARTETVLTTEVSGVVEMVSPHLFAGSFFRKGEVLLEVDKVEYAAALANAHGMLAGARLAYAQEQSLSEQAQIDWKELGRGQPSDLVLRKPQLEKAMADMKTAEATVVLAKRNLSKTTVRAPYDGRVHTKFVDVGQTVNARMTQLARIFSVDVAEVRLPISSKEAGYISIPETYRDGTVNTNQPKVTLSSVMGARTWTWEGIIDRTEGVIDPSTRQIFLIARVEDPYGISGDPNRPPLKVGQFVKAKITGKEIGLGVRVPRSALKPGEVVYVVDDFDRLRITPVSVAQAGISEVYVTAGLEEGDRICLTQLGIVVDGMDVEVESGQKSILGEIKQ
jgi:RND family efflux transporter MFP subunit